MMKRILENKYLICLLVFTFFVLVYCASRTFIINDDLPYSFYYRSENRITDLRQIILNQIQDYNNISARIFVHSIVQFLLIFGKSLWMWLNPFMIIVTVLLMAYIVKLLISKNDFKFFWVVLASICAFLLLYGHKYLIYWVAGSVNYVWIFVLILLFIIYVLKNNLLKRPILSFIICFCLSMLHECSAIFVICFLISSMFIKLFEDREQFKKGFWKYLIFLFGCILGFSFLMLAPSTLNRVVDGEFGHLSLFSKLLISIPAISDNLFNVCNIYNLYPIIFSLSLGFIIFFKYNKYTYVYLTVLATFVVLGMAFNNSWFWFILGVFLLIVQTLVFIKNKQYLFIAVLIGAYAVAYSLAITPEYLYGRTNYHFFLIISLAIIYNFYNGINGKIAEMFFKGLLVVLFILLLCFEICIYSYIGEVRRDREINILKAKDNGTKIIELREIKSPYSRFHIDSNSPSDETYWAYKHFLHYYNLDDDVKTLLKKY